MKRIEKAIGAHGRFIITLYFPMEDLKSLLNNKISGLVELIH